MLARDHHPTRAGQVLLGDSGFTARNLHAFHGDLHVRRLRPDRRDDEPAHMLKKQSTECRHGTTSINFWIGSADP